MKEGTRTVVASLVAAMMIAICVASVVPYIIDDDSDGVRTGYFDRFPKDFGPGEKDYGTPEEAYTEFKKVLEENRPFLEDRDPTDEGYAEAEIAVTEAFHILEEKIELFTADYYDDVLSLGDEMAEWNEVYGRAWSEAIMLFGEEDVGIPDDILAEIERLQHEEGVLIAEKQSVLARNSTIVYEGETYSFNDLRVPKDIRIAHCREICYLLGPIMLELVENRNLQARLMGYDSYIEYSFGLYNSEGITVDMVKRLSEEVREPVDELYGILRNADVDLKYENGDDLLKTVRPFLNGVSGDLGRLMDHLADNDMIYCDPDPSRTAIVYTSDLKAHGSALIYVGPPYDELAVLNIIHEFGHAATFSLVGYEDRPWDTDEIFGMSLEALAIGKPDLILPDDSVDFATSGLYALIGKIDTNAVTTLLQIALYSGEITTTDGIMEFMHEHSGDEQTEVMWWYNDYAFTAPFYTPSYVTAGITALGVLVESLEDWDAAAESYLRMLAGNATGYYDAIELAGLPDIYGEGVAAGILEDILDYAKTISSGE